ncbi:hypothetical protein P4S72_05945 [Vibrio sp. PP-XX7]
MDWLETQEEIDAQRIGMEGVSLGGYYCPRAVAFEPRLPVAWYGGKRRLARCAETSSEKAAQLWCRIIGDACPLGSGAQKMADAFMKIAEDIHLDGEHGIASRCHSL